jgi:hypothetical protein
MSKPVEKHETGLLAIVAIVVVVGIIAALTGALRPENLNSGKAYRQVAGFDDNYPATTYKLSQSSSSNSGSAYCQCYSPNCDCSSYTNSASCNAAPKCIWMAG